MPIKMRMKMIIFIKGNILGNKEKYITLLLKNTNFKKNILSEKNFTQKSMHTIFSLFQILEQKKLIYDEINQYSCCFSENDGRSWLGGGTKKLAELMVMFYILRGV